MKNKRILKKGFEKLLLMINTLIFCFMGCINELEGTAYIILLILGITFYINYKILKKYGNIIK